MDVERRVKLFRTGPDQAVRIPHDLALPGDEAILRREGDRLVIQPAPRASLLAVLAGLTALDDEFPPVDDPPPQPVDV